MSRPARAFPRAHTTVCTTPHTHEHGIVHPARRNPRPGPWPTGHATTRAILPVPILNWTTPRPQQSTTILSDLVPGPSSRRRSRSTACIAQSPPSRCNLHRDHARSIKPRTPSGANPCCSFAPSLHSLSSLSLAEEAIAVPGQQNPRNLAGARVAGRSRGSMPTVSPCSSPAPSRFSAKAWS
jgi:hypothetical protein